MNDVERICECGTWPAWPFLPMKRNGIEDFGVLWCKDGNNLRFPISLYRANIWDMPKTAEELEDALITKFDSIEALLAAGGEGDE
jgi:hypothetical protein